ncbi:MAG TPA: PEGA domain-containing protein [Blattabacteriaceae bacterium]|nr:PEGA domain-containing protein [Blattabacteriaceae bacterium]
MVTQPVGAEVFVDGNLAGKTPIVFNLFREEKPRVITVKLDGYKTEERSVTPDGKTIPIGITLSNSSELPLS